MKSRTSTGMIAWTAAGLTAAILLGGCGVPGEAAGQEAESTEEAVASDAAMQKETLSRIRNLGNAMMSWLTDQVGAASAGQSVAVRDYGLEPTSAGELQEWLHPSDTFFYMKDIPMEDGWGHPLEVYVSSELLAASVFMIRSPGRDGVFEAEEYEVHGFPREDYDSDIVWVDGYFIRWPESDEK